MSHLRRQVRRISNANRAISDGALYALHLLCPLSPVFASAKECSSGIEKTNHAQSMPWQNIPHYFPLGFVLAVPGPRKGP